MQDHTREAVTGLQLDTSFHTPKTPQQLRMFQSIAAETEFTRAALRSDPSWGFPVTLPVRGFAPAAKRLGQRQITLADMLPWPALLTMRGCANNAALRADCAKEDLLEFALSICPYEHIVTVLNFMAMGQGISDTAKILSPLIRGLKAKEARIKQGASIGGSKSARTRQSNAKTVAGAKRVHWRGRQQHFKGRRSHASHEVIPRPGVCTDPASRNRTHAAQSHCQNRGNLRLPRRRGRAADASRAHGTQDLQAASPRW